jgi:hypothetical protein
MAQAGLALGHRFDQEVRLCNSPTKQPDGTTTLKSASILVVAAHACADVDLRRPSPGSALLSSSDAVGARRGHSPRAQTR